MSSVMVRGNGDGVVRGMRSGRLVSAGRGARAPGRSDGDRVGGARALVWKRGGPEGAMDVQQHGEVTGDCKCRMHKKAQVGVPEGVGCWKIAIGNHVAVRAAEMGDFHVCAVQEVTRIKDGYFREMCMNPDKKGPMAYESDRAYSFVRTRYATGGSTLNDFGRGYCYLPAVRDGFENRVARVFGPNMYVADLLKVLCVAGRRAMKPLSVREVANGFLHVEHVAGAHEVATAGREFYSELVKYVKVNPYVRIGACVEKSVLIPAHRVVSEDVRKLQFGDFVLWSDDVEEEVLSAVERTCGASIATALRSRLGRKVECNVDVDCDEKAAKAKRAVINRHNKRLAKMLKRGVATGGMEFITVSASSATRDGGVVEHCEDLIDLKSECGSESCASTGNSSSTSFDWADDVIGMSL